MTDLILDFDLEEDKRKLFSILKSLKGKNVIQIKKWRKKRSIDSNSYLWGVCYRYISDCTGYTKEESHQAMGQLFLKYPKGQHFFIRSTTDLDTAEMGEYIDKIKAFAMDQFSCFIPDPSDVLFAE